MDIRCFVDHSNNNEVFFQSKDCIKALTKIYDPSLADNLEDDDEITPDFIYHNICGWFIKTLGDMSNEIPFKLGERGAVRSEECDVDIDEVIIKEVPHTVRYEWRQDGLYFNLNDLIEFTAKRKKSALCAASLDGEDASEITEFGFDRFFCSLECLLPPKE